MKTPKQAKAYVQERKPVTTAEAKGFFRDYWAQSRNICLGCGEYYDFGIVHDCAGGEMKKIKILAELTYDDKMIYGTDKDAKKWFLDDILKKDILSVHSLEIGDIIGEIKIKKILSGKAD